MINYVTGNKDKGMKKICFVSLNAYPLLSNKNHGYAGGGELQQVLIGKELSKRGYDVSFITYKEFDDYYKIIDGIRILPSYPRDQVQHLNNLKKILILWKQMKKVRADIYIYQCGCPGIVTFFSKIHGSRIIKILASDSELTGEHIINSKDKIGKPSDFLRYFDLRYSDVIISQNVFQKKMLDRNFGLKSSLIKNPMKLVKNEKTNSDFILWVGTIRTVKQPELFLKLAKKLPNHKFTMIGGIGESEKLYKYIEREAKTIPNLEFKGFIPHHEIFYYYQNALFLVNTSKVEGFPNIFLEAWMHSIPVISLNVDPDGIIDEYILGFHSENFDELIKNIDELCKNDKLRRRMGEKGRAYVEKEHDIRKIVDKFECILNMMNKKIRN